MSLVLFFHCSFDLISDANENILWTTTIWNGKNYSVFQVKSDFSFKREMKLGRRQDPNSLTKLQPSDIKTGKYYRLQFLTRTKTLG